MTKATVKFGFRSYFEVSCLSHKFQPLLIDDVINVIKESTGLDSYCSIEPFQTKAYGQEHTSFRVDILNLNRYLTPEEQETLISNFKASNFSFVSIA